MNDIALKKLTKPNLWIGKKNYDCVSTIEKKLLRLESRKRSPPVGVIYTRIEVFSG
jgi:hypothetical protein